MIVLKGGRPKSLKCYPLANINEGNVPLSHPTMGKENSIIHRKTSMKIRDKGIISSVRKQMLKLISCVTNGTSSCFAWTNKFMYNS